MMINTVSLIAGRIKPLGVPRRDVNLEWTEVGRPALNVSSTDPRAGVPDGINRKK